jgi:hypothetical protein
VADIVAKVENRTTLKIFVRHPKKTFATISALFGPAEAASEYLQLEDERTYLWRDLTSDFDPQEICGKS